jgi:hypothetical protein
MFREENNFGLLYSFLIFVLAIIIIAAIQILREINTEDIKSMPISCEVDI